jgi:hypothetical protein
MVTSLREGNKEHRLHNAVCNSVSDLRELGQTEARSEAETARLQLSLRQPPRKIGRPKHEERWRRDS